MTMQDREMIVGYLKGLRDRICADFESIETEGKFERKTWDYHKGEGGGEMSVLRGEVFEKAAVNWSGVAGPHFPMKDGSGPFFATGVSLITHMKNPKMPTVHFNIRYIESGDKCWFGGGYDLTPMGFPFDEDTEHFHGVAKNALAEFGEGTYEKYRDWAKEYFWIKHRNRERGIGGVFFDHVNTGDEVRDLAMWKSVGDTFLDAVMPIYRRRIDEPYTEEDQKVQYERRGHYVEFNLVYDRGTRFGFESGGNTEAILCSMPPVATW
jgi:coproporphyrinogen III oxidase